MDIGRRRLFIPRNRELLQPTRGGEELSAVDVRVAAGAAAAAQINADLVAEETRQAVAAYWDPPAAESEARLERAIVDRRHGL